MASLQEQLVSLQKQLDKMNSLPVNIIVEEGSTELVKRQLEQQIANIKRQIELGL